MAERRTQNYRITPESLQGLRLLSARLTAITGDRVTMIDALAVALKQVEMATDAQLKTALDNRKGGDRRGLDQEQRP